MTDVKLTLVSFDAIKMSTWINHLRSTSGYLKVIFTETKQVCCFFESALACTDICIYCYKLSRNSGGEIFDIETVIFRKLAFC